MEIAILILIIDIIYVGILAKGGHGSMTTEMRVERCDFKSCGVCRDNGQCNMINRVESEK